ncbi:uncharacterized protein KIAA2026 isoform X2 [Osmerus eperlanus]|uniref:uncharacterized protein KIAA2026 isoform X2 n=1 Tax=Osmerus eperlanus TaxID=29151 RepID=UPI002E0F50D5
MRTPPASKMKGLQTDACNPPNVHHHTMLEQDMSNEAANHTGRPLLFHNQDCTSESDSGPHHSGGVVHIVSSSDPKWHSSTECDPATEGLSNGACGLENVSSHCDSSTDLALSQGVSEISNDLSLPEVCISSNTAVQEEDLSYEVQQAYRIFSGFLLDKHKGITTPFLHPIGLEDQSGVGLRVRGQTRQSMCLRRMEEKFLGREYETITEFVADFRLMLENCYRHHGVDHWVSKQAQKLEIMLEQKLTLLSRTLRERTTLVMTSKGRFGAEDQRGPALGGTSTRRRSVPRSLATITVGGHESLMVQALRLEEQQRVKEERRQRELEKKEAEETSAKEVEEWEGGLLSQASPWSIHTMWELPAIGHFLCLAQAALNLPEIVFFELERCLLMPRCSSFLAKVMSSLLCAPQRRPTLHRRPALPYRRWEAELRLRVLGWYRAVGAAEDQGPRAEQLGLDQQVFRKLGEVSPLEEHPFHLLSFLQRVWLLKALCDNVYQTQKEVQDAVLGQPIHECRESILGYDGQENAYIHFPHFCGADLRIYCQSPSLPPQFPLPPVQVRRLEPAEGEDGGDSDPQKGEEQEEVEEGAGSCSLLVSMKTEEQEEKQVGGGVKGENGEVSGAGTFHPPWGLKKEEASSSDEEEVVKEDLKLNVRRSSRRSLSGQSGSRDCVSSGGRNRRSMKEEPLSEEDVNVRHRVKREVKTELREPCLSVGEHSYTGRSPARSAPTPARTPKVEAGATPSPAEVHGTCLECSQGSGSEQHRNCHCSSARLSSGSESWSGSGSGSSHDRPSEGGRMERIRTKRKKRKRKRGGGRVLRSLTGGGGGRKRPDRSRRCRDKAAESALETADNCTVKKDRRKQEIGKTVETQKLALKKTKPLFQVEPAFKLVCTSLQELRELISRTEDELDELESAKKRSGRWYFKREAVKDLHITLIRLLNELSPWEPKLVKAFHRNRLRLKKDHDDFKKHPEYANFVREEWVAEEVARRARRGDGASSSSSSFSDCSSRLEEEEEEDTVPRGLWAAADLKQVGTEAAVDGLVTLQQVGTPGDLRPITRYLKRMGSDVEDHPALRKRCRAASGADLTVPSSCGGEADLQSRPGAREQNPAGVVQTHIQTQIQAGRTGPAVLSPAVGYPRRYQPIPTLLAKSVGNKVTLMHRPPSPEPPPAPPAPPGQPPNRTLTSSSPHATGPSLLASLQHSQPPSSLPTFTPTPAAKLQLPATSSATAPMAGKSPGPTSPVPKSPVRVVYQVPEALGLLKKDGSPVKISVQPLLDQKTRDQIMHQVVILPSSLLLHRPSEERKELRTKTARGSSPSKPSSGLSLPGGSSIPIQPVAPLKEPRGGRDGTPSPHVSTRQLQTLPAGFKVVHAPGSKTSTPQTVMPNRSLTASAVSTDSSEAHVDPKQELKTICIRDSQSILVTTRGGNTGVVKVQASSEQNPHGLSPNSPVITISPQLKAFLVSKTSPPPLAPSTDPSSTAPRSSMVPQSQSQSSPSGLRISTGPALHHTPVSPTPSSPSIPASSIVTLAMNRGPGLISLPAAAKPGLASASASQTTVAVSTQGPLSPNCPVTLPQSPSMPMLGLTQNALLQCVSSPAGKRAGADDKQPITKFILVTPTSNATPTPIKPVVLPGSKLMFVSQSTVCSSPTTTSSIGSIPKQAQVPGLVGQPLTSSEPADAGKKGAHRNPNVCNTSTSEVLSMVPSFALPSGVQIRLPGQTTSNATQHPVKGSPFCISRPGGLAASSTGLVLVQSTSTIPSLGPVGSRGSGAGKVETPHCAVRTTQPTPPHIQDPQYHNPSGAIGTPAQVIKAPPPSPRAMPSSPVTPAGNVCTSPTPGTTGTVQQRIVINTSAPLAAGTQILLNNTRFVVPPQGLGPGSHILIITSPAPAPQGASPATSCPLGSTLPGTLAPVSAPLPVGAPALVPVPTRLAGTVVPALAPTQPAQQGPRMATPGAQPQKVALRLPATPIHPSISLSVPRQVGAVRAPLLASSTLSSSSPPGSFGAGQVVGSTQSTLKQAVLPTGATRTPVRAQLMSTVQPIQALTTRTQGPPTAAVPPIGSALSRVQSLPIATVLPIGSSFNSTQVAPVAVVPPSNSTVITTPAQPIRTLRTSETVTLPVALPNQMQDLEKPLVQVPFMSPVVPTKLLVSPDGAVLNTVLGPVNQASPVGLSALNSTLVVSPSVSSVRVLPSLGSDGSMDGTPTPTGTGLPDL